MPSAPPSACLEPRCPHPAVERGRCARHRRTQDERGYGPAHHAARRRLAAGLPAPCGYCGVVVHASERWVAAHRADGDPRAGWMVAHALCNERAKGGEGSTRAPEPQIAHPRGRLHAPPLGQANPGWDPADG